MIAIMTKYIGPTNSRGSRIKAWTCNGQSVTVSYDYSKSHEKLYWKAAKALIEKLGWQGECKEGLIAGGSPDGYIFVFANGEKFTI